MVLLLLLIIFVKYYFVTEVFRFKLSFGNLHKFYNYALCGNTKGPSESTEKASYQAGFSDRHIMKMFLSL